MISVGVRELREEGEIIEITMRGEPAARVIPIKRRPLPPEEIEKQFADLDELIAEIAARTIDNVGAVETVREIRRDL